MVTLINIVREGNLLKVNYYEDTDWHDLGYIEYDIEKRKVVAYSYSNSEKEGPLKRGYHKTIEAIEMMLEGGTDKEFVKTLHYYWY